MLHILEGIPSPTIMSFNIDSCKSLIIKDNEEEKRTLILPSLNFIIVISPHVAGTPYWVDKISSLSYSEDKL